MAKKTVKRPNKPAEQAANTAATSAIHSQSSSHKPSFPVVAVGASAGGLEAFTEFLNYLPRETGMAFVLIQHLDPDQHSQLTDLLARTTKIPVEEVKSDTPVKPDHVYVISPRISLLISDGTLRTGPRPTRHNLPIDGFMQSLAQEYGSNAIGVVLSGNASDGTLGLKAIKAEGGVTFVQEPSSAKFDGMPRSAIAAGVMDFVLPPAGIAQRLGSLAQYPYISHEADKSDDVETDAHLNRIFYLLRTVTGNDFTHYKAPTIRRRIHRRMVLHGAQKLSDYVAALQDKPAEVRALADDLLISVTSFFRDPKAFDILNSKVIPQLLKKRPADDPIRVWVPGCATGEEAYSIAICLSEFLEKSDLTCPIQVFATDVSEISLEKARAGIYAMPALAGMPPARLKRYFKKVEGGYQIQKSIRKTCIFARQNLVKDPPFRNLDLISCCNVLIYLASVLQRKALAIFHYALKPGGFLVLGHSEGVGALPGAFKPFDKKVKIYSKTTGPAPLSVKIPSDEFMGPRTLLGNEMSGDTAKVAIDIQKAAERMLLAQYAPAGVIVDHALNVIHVRGDTGRYLHLAPGEPTYNLLRMAGEGLLVPLRAAFAGARRKGSAASQPARVRHHGQTSEINVKVIPISGPLHANPDHFMVLFEEIEQPVPGHGGTRVKKPPGRGAKVAAAEPLHAKENSRLRQELVATREYLQSIIEEQEASAEELKSASEEAQATNEELETAKEELQSTNEELNTVNEELKNRNETLIELNEGLSILLNSIDIPLVIVTRDLKIKRFTKAVEPMLNLIDSDEGRSIADLKPNIDVPDLVDLLRNAAMGKPAGPREIQGPDSRWYSLQILPYQVEKRAEGALLTLRDIDAVKRGRDYAEAVVQSTAQPLVILGKDLRVISANSAFYDTFKLSRKQTRNRLIHDLGNRAWNVGPFRNALDKILDTPGIKEIQVEHEFETIGRKVLLLGAREIQQPAPYGQTILLAIEDITERAAHSDHALAAERRMRNLESELARVFRALTVGELATSVAHEVNQPLAGIVTNAEAGLRWLAGDAPNIHAAQESLALIVRDGNRASDVIRRIREFLKRNEMEMAAFDINDAIQEAIALTRTELDRNRITLNTGLSPHLPPVQGNRVLLQQVVVNLIMNSCEAMSSDGQAPRELLVRSSRIDENGVLVAVSDTGIGIDPQNADKIFDAFFTTKPNGIGMGLSITRSIIEAHGGRIWATPNEGRGLTVQFQLLFEGAETT